MQKNQAVVTYGCDECGKEEAVEVDGMMGVPPPPTGWVSIMGQPMNQDLFCSWECVGAYAPKKAKERAARLAKAK